MTEEGGGPSEDEQTPALHKGRPRGSRRGKEGGTGKNGMGAWKESSDSYLCFVFCPLPIPNLL